MDAADLDDQDLRSQIAHLDSRECTATGLLEHAIEHGDRLDAPFGLFISRITEFARTEAADIDRRRGDGEPLGALAGVPIGVKDILLTEQAPTTSGSLVPAPYGEQDRLEDAAAVAALRAAGAIVVGKTNTAEFAIGTPDPSKPLPLARNPWSLEHWAGGSSSGSASGVALGAFAAALGTDTGGSIRVPAAFCGITGFKPTFGTVGRAGCVPLSDSLDHVGPLARSAADCAVLMDVLAATDRSFADALGRGVAGLRIGYDDLLRISAGTTDPAAPAAFAAAVDTFDRLDARTCRVELPLYGELTTATWIVLAAEAFAHHERQLSRHWADYGAGTRAFLAGGADHSVGSYLRAQRVRQLAHARTTELFDQVDVLITPTVSFAAPPLDGPGGTPAPLDMRGIHTGYWSGLGYPAVSVPVGFNADGLPLAVQIVARPHHDRLVLAVADAFQRRTDWHLRIPPDGRCGAPAPAVPPARAGEARGPDPAPAERAAIHDGFGHAATVDVTLAALADADRQPLPNLVLD